MKMQVSKKQHTNWNYNSVPFSLKMQFVYDRGSVTAEFIIPLLIWVFKLAFFFSGVTAGFSGPLKIEPFEADSQRPDTLPVVQQTVFFSSN